MKRSPRLMGRPAVYSVLTQSQGMHDNLCRGTYDITSSGMTPLPPPLLSRQQYRYFCSSRSTRTANRLAFGCACEVIAIVDVFSNYKERGTDVRALTGCIPEGR